MELPINYIITLGAVSLLAVCGIAAWLLAMVKIKELEEELTQKTKNNPLKRDYYEELQLAGHLIEQLLYQLAKLPLIKIEDSYRVTYSIHNREKAKVRIRRTNEETARTRKIEEAVIGYGEAEKWISLEAIESAYHDVSSETDSTKIIKRCNKLFK